MVLYKNPYSSITKQTRNHIKRTLRYFQSQNIHSKNILDLGQRSPLTDALEETFNIKIDNSKGDLDAQFGIPNKIYDIIIYSHTIEHQFNPLHTLLKIKSVMNENSTLYIITPDRTKILWCKGHYHEIDSYRMQLLLERAGYKLISIKRQKVYREWKKYLCGFRPILRLFLEYSAVYVAKIEKL